MTTGRYNAVFLLFLFVACAHVQKPSKDAAWKRFATSTIIGLNNWNIDHPKDIKYLSLTVQNQIDTKNIYINDVRSTMPTIEDKTTLQSYKPEYGEGFFLISHYHRGNVNRLGGHFSEFHKHPSSASIAIDTIDNEDRGLDFFYDNRPGGYAGFWIHLFHTLDPPDERVFLDVTGAKYLTFLIRGQNPRQQVDLRVADRKWESKEDSLLVGNIAKFIKSGRIDRTWQKVWVPISALPEQIEKTELAVLVLSIQGHHKGRIFVKDLALTTDLHVLLPKAVQPPPMSRQLQKAIWLWTTQDIVRDRKKTRSLIEFCKRDAVSDVFMQLPYTANKEGSRWRIELDTRELAPLISSLAKLGVRVDALDGDPRYALKPHHAKVISMVRKVIEFNRSVLPDQRFHGIRFDIEPYLLPNYPGQQKQTILRQYLRLIRKVKALTQREGLSFGVDIPFWYDEMNQYYEKAAEVDGRPISEWIIDTVDNLAIMDYRTKAYGPDGVIAHGRSELEYAASKGKKVFIGLETVNLPDETIQEFSINGHGANVVFECHGNRNCKLYWFSEDNWQKVAGIVEKDPTLFMLSQVSHTDIPADKLSFYNRDVKDLYSVMKLSMFELLHLPSFFGFAIHSYESYRPWLMKIKKNNLTIPDLDIDLSSNLKE